MSKLAAGIEILAHKGLNLLSIFQVSDLPAPARSRMIEAGVPVTPATRLILIGNGGSKFWTHFRESKTPGPNPVDDYSLRQAGRFADKTLGKDHYRTLYPGEFNIPLQQLGLFAGWHHPSPLGLGINPKWGLWFAYRCLLATEEELPQILDKPEPSPCDRCRSRACVNSCPADAVHKQDALELDQCIEYRLDPVSRCADRCLSRLTCPASGENRYSLEQVQYHYRQSLQTLRRHFDPAKDNG